MSKNLGASPKRNWTGARPTLLGTCAATSRPTPRGTVNAMAEFIHVLNVIMCGVGYAFTALLILALINHALGW